MLGIYRFRHVPVHYCPKGSTLPCCSSRLWRLTSLPGPSGFDVRSRLSSGQAVVCPWPELRSSECQEGCPVWQYTFLQLQSSSGVSNPPIKAEGDCLCVSHEWRPPAAQLRFAGLGCLSSWAGSLSPEGREGDTSSAGLAVSLKGLLGRAQGN